METAPVQITKTKRDRTFDMNWTPVWLDSKKAFILSVVIKRVGVGVACKITCKVNLGYSFNYINDELRQSTVTKKGPRFVFNLLQNKHGRHSGCPTIGLNKKSKRSTSHIANLCNNLQFNSESQNIVAISPSSAKIALMSQWGHMKRV